MQWKYDTFNINITHVTSLYLFTSPQKIKVLVHSYCEGEKKTYLVKHF